VVLRVRVTMPSASPSYSSLLLAAAAPSPGSHHPSQIAEGVGTEFQGSEEVEYEWSQAAGALLSAKPREKFVSYIYDVSF